MKFVISRNELSNLIRKIQNVVPLNAPIPILSHILVETSGEELIFTATDLTVGTKCTTAAKIYEKGALSLPSKRFFQLVRELTEANIEISATENDMVEIIAGSSRFRLHSVSKDDFPALPDMQTATKITVDSEQLREVLQRTAFAVSKEDSRFVLTGVLLKVENSVATFVGTDGKRLAKSELDMAITADFQGEYIIPIKAVEEINKLFTEPSKLTLYLSTDKLALESENTQLITKLLSGSYPDFEPVISTKSMIELDLHREELITLLKQVSLFTSDSFNSVRFTFNPGELLLTANCANVGEGKVSMPVNYSGGKVEIAFNPFFFLDILKHTKDQTVKLGISDSYNPGVITDSTRSLFIIMPMRLHEGFSE